VSERMDSNPYNTLFELAGKRAMAWDPFTQNHDPSFISALRNAYQYGFCAGHGEASRTPETSKPPMTSADVAKVFAPLPPDEAAALREYGVDDGSTEMSELPVRTDESTEK
jgi:hypothetical protein